LGESAWLITERCRRSRWQHRRESATTVRSRRRPIVGACRWRGERPRRTTAWRRERSRTARNTGSDHASGKADYRTGGLTGIPYTALPAPQCRRRRRYVALSPADGEQAVATITAVATSGWGGEGGTAGAARPRGRSSSTAIPNRIAAMAPCRYGSSLPRSRKSCGVLRVANALWLRRRQVWEGAYQCKWWLIARGVEAGR
jgi:hypothetical protein